MSWRGMRGRALVAVACAAAIAGCAGTTTGTGTEPSGGATPAAQPSPATALPASWPEHELVAEGEALSLASQVYDPATGMLYALVPRTSPTASGPHVLEAIDVRTGATRRGGTYQATGLALADGELWVYSSTGARPQVAEVGLGSLTTVRYDMVPSGAGPFGSAAPVVAGPAGSVWIGTSRALLRVSVRSGAVLARVALPAGLGLSGIAADPAGGDLYVSAAHEAGGGAFEGAVVLEYAAGTGALLATADGAPISDSVAGAELTGVPGGVWVSFRTGMLGVSVLLSSRRLAVVAAGDPASPATSVYHWAMSSQSVYGGGTLWVATVTGLVACVNPATGKVMAAETVTSATARPGSLLLADPATRELTGVVMSGTGGALVSVSPPSRCWR